MGWEFKGQHPSHIDVGKGEFVKFVAVGALFARASVDTPFLWTCHSNWFGLVMR